MENSQKLYNKAKELIPGGTQLLSKRPEMHLPEAWPAYYKRAKGCEIWDHEGKHYIDVSYMGIGSCVLGYADEDVNTAVKQAIDQGNMTTLNCSDPESWDVISVFADCRQHQRSQEKYGHNRRSLEWQNT